MRTTRCFCYIYIHSYIYLSINQSVTVSLSRLIHIFFCSVLGGDSDEASPYAPPLGNGGFGPRANDANDALLLLYRYTSIYLSIYLSVTLCLSIFFCIFLLLLSRRRHRRCAPLRTALGQRRLRPTCRRRAAPLI